MKSFFLLLIAFSLFVSFARAQDTFSIVAADSATRETGSAGASCVDLFAAGYADASFLGDLLPDTGAINTQASYSTTNQRNARQRMRAGDDPSQIIDWLTSNDATSNPSIRQYGIVGFTGSAVSASGYTGVNCLDYKNHVTGSIKGIYYSLQGNILLGAVVLDSMEAYFRRAPGDIACRLMAALQGAKMIGADTRCASNGTSTLFAFVKVAKPTDVYGNPSFILTVKTHDNANIEPIDSLQVLFNMQHSCSTTGTETSVIDDPLVIYPNPSGDQISVIVNVSRAGDAYRVTDLYGRCLLAGVLKNGKEIIDIHSLPAGMYFIEAGNSCWKRFIKM